jgi:Zeta toxin
MTPRYLVSLAKPRRAKSRFSRSLCGSLFAADRGLGFALVGERRDFRLSQRTTRRMEHAYEVAGIAAAVRAALIAARLDFCTETVFSHQSKVDFVTTAVTAGYDVVLHVVMIPFVLSELRVGARVCSGGTACRPPRRPKIENERRGALSVTSPPLQLRLASKRLARKLQNGKQR